MARGDGSNPGSNLTRKNNNGQDFWPKDSATQVKATTNKIPKIVKQKTSELSSSASGIFNTYNFARSTPNHSKSQKIDNYLVSPNVNLQINKSPLNSTNQKEKNTTKSIGKVLAKTATKPRPKPETDTNFELSVLKSEQFSINTEVRKSKITVLNDSVLNFQPNFDNLASNTSYNPGWPLDFKKQPSSNMAGAFFKRDLSQDNEKALFTSKVTKGKSLLSRHRSPDLNLTGDQFFDKSALGSEEGRIASEKTQSFNPLYISLGGEKADGPFTDLAFLGFNDSYALRFKENRYKLNIRQFYCTKAFKTKSTLLLFGGLISTGATDSILKLNFQFSLDSRSQSTNQKVLTVSYRLENTGRKMREKKFGFAGILYKKKYVYLAGGNNGIHELSTFERVNIETFKVSQLANLMIPRDEPAMASCLNSDYIIVMGGFSSTLRSTIASVERYDIRTNEWTFVASMNEPRRAFAAIRTVSGIFVIGGTNESRVLNSIEQYVN